MVKRLIKKILKEDRRQMYLNKIIQIMKNDFPLFKNMELYGFYDQLSEDELIYVLSEIFGEPVQRINQIIFNEKGNQIYLEYSDGTWEKWKYDENGNWIYNENSDGYWEKTEYNENGKLIYYENSNGYWRKIEYNENGNIIYIENSEGEWKKWEYDKKGKKIYYENSHGEIIDNR